MKTTITLLFISTLCFAQTKKFTDKEICSAYETYKGKKNHGQKYCVSWMTIRTFSDGKTDTVGWSSSGRSFFGGTYDAYNSLSNRNKFVYDSLSEDGLINLTDNESYLIYESRYMREKSKIQDCFKVTGNKITIYKYLLYNDEKHQGFELRKSYVLK